MTDINELFSEYSKLQQRIEDIRVEIPELGKAEKELEKLKKEIQDFAKEFGNFVSSNGYVVVLSCRTSWDGKKLEGLALAHPEINSCKSVSTVATIRKEKDV